MRHLFLLLICLISIAGFSQPESGDYLVITTPVQSRVHYIFKNQKVYYGYDMTSRKSETSYDADIKRINQLFLLADKTHLEKITALNEKNIVMDPEHTTYKILEYKKGDKKYRVCWDAMKNDPVSLKLNTIMLEMGSFW